MIKTEYEKIVKKAKKLENFKKLSNYQEEKLLEYWFKIDRYLAELNKKENKLSDCIEAGDYYYEDLKL